MTLGDKVSGKMAQMGLSDETLSGLPGPLTEAAARIFRAWEIGTTLRDMLFAAEHSKHVVRSVRTLGVSVSTRKAGLDVNESIRKTLSLMGSSLRTINVQLQLPPLPPISRQRRRIGPDLDEPHQKCR